MGDHESPGLVHDAVRHAAGKGAEKGVDWLWKRTLEFLAEYKFTTVVATLLGVNGIYLNWLRDTPALWAFAAGLLVLTAAVLTDNRQRKAVDLTLTALKSDIEALKSTPA